MTDTSKTAKSYERRRYTNHTVALSDCRAQRRDGGEDDHQSISIRSISQPASRQYKHVNVAACAANESQAQTEL